MHFIPEGGIIGPALSVGLSFAIFCLSRVRPVSVRVSFLAETAPDQYDIFSWIRAPYKKRFKMVAASGDSCRLGLSTVVYIFL